MLDRVALLIGWGLPLFGLMGGTRILLESTDHGASFPGGWLAGLLGAICMMGTTILAGLGASSVLRVLVQWLSLHRQPPEAESQSILVSLAERIDQLSERLAEPHSPSVPLPPALADIFHKLAQGAVARRDPDVNPGRGSGTKQRPSWTGIRPLSS